MHLESLKRLAGEAGAAGRLKTSLTSSRRWMSIRFRIHLEIRQGEAGAVVQLYLLRARLWLLKSLSIVREAVAVAMHHPVGVLKSLSFRKLMEVKAAKCQLKIWTGYLKLWLLMVHGRSRVAFLDITPSTFI